MGDVFDLGWVFHRAAVHGDEHAAGVGDHMRVGENAVFADDETGADAATESADVQKNNVEVQRSNLLDTDLATATAGLVKSNALLQAAQSIMTKLDANSLFQKL